MAIRPSRSLMLSDVQGTTTSVRQPVRNRVTGTLTLRQPVPSAASPTLGGATLAGTVKPNVTPKPAPPPPPAPTGAPPPQSPPLPMPASSPVVNPTLVPPGTQPLTGQEAPFQVLPQRNDALQALLAQLQQQALVGLEQPTVYDDATFKQARDLAVRGIEEDAARRRGELEGELTRRGVANSSIAGQFLTDLAKDTNARVAGVNTDLLRERALALASGREAAARQAQGVAGLTDALDRATRDELRGERSYLDYLGRQAVDDARFERAYGDESAFRERNYQDDQFQRLLGALLGTTSQDIGAGLGGLQGAGGLFGAGAVQQSQLAGRYADQLQAILAGLFGPGGLLGARAG